MSLKTIVKVGAITNLSDARYCAGMGVDMLGFCFSRGSDNYIEIEKFKEINNWVSGVEIIAEFENESISEVEEILKSHDFNGVMSSNIDIAADLKSNGKKVILNVKIESEQDIDSFNEKITNYEVFDYVQINTENDELVILLENRLPIWSQQVNILKSFNVNVENISTHISQELYSGIALMGSQEEKPGMKDYDEIADILEALEDEG